MWPKDFEFRGGGEKHEVTLSVIYVHPDTHNGCPNIDDKKIRNHSATGATPDNACQQALALAKKKPPICPSCKAVYQMKVVINTQS